MRGSPKEKEKEKNIRSGSFLLLRGSKLQRQALGATLRRLGGSANQ